MVYLNYSDTSRKIIINLSSHLVKVGYFILLFLLVFAFAISLFFICFYITFLLFGFN